MSRGQQIPSCERSIFLNNLVSGTKFCPATCPLNSNQFELWGHVTATKQRYTPVKRKVASCELFMRHVPATKQRYTPVTRKVASCELFMRQVPATLRKMNQSENEIITCPSDKTLRVNTSRNLSLQHAPSCEQCMKFFPGTCPCNMSTRVSRPYQVDNLKELMLEQLANLKPMKLICRHWAMNVRMEYLFGGA